MKIDRKEIVAHRSIMLTIKSFRIFQAIPLFIIFFLVAGFDGLGQSSLETLINNAKENNKALISAQKYFEAEVMGARTGNSPDNPEIEYAYLWGSPEQLGNRVDFAVTQSFDFPTAYSSRSKLSKINRQQAKFRLKNVEQDIVVMARQAWFNAVYLIQKNYLLEKRLNNAKLISLAFQRMYEEGEANQLQLNQAKLKATALSNEMNRLQADMITNETEINWLNGGGVFVVTDSTFPETSPIFLDTLINMYQSGPQNASFKGEIVKMEQQKEVAFNQKLPKLKAGYYQESILGTQQKGIRAGITIPLWENANAVKTAKAGIIYAQTNAIRFWEQQQLQISQMYKRWLILGDQVDEMSELLNNSNNDELLLKALEGGEISLTQYYYESDFYFQNQFDLLDLQRELYILESELLRVMY